MAPVYTWVDLFAASLLLLFRHSCVANIVGEIRRRWSSKITLSRDVLLLLQFVRLVSLLGSYDSLQHLHLVLALHRLGLL